MEICFTINGVRHCFVLPVLEFPIHWPKPGPGPVNYPTFIQDAIILASVRKLVQNIGDSGIRDTVASGIGEAMRAVQKRGGEHTEVNADL